MKETFLFIFAFYIFNELRPAENYALITQEARSNCEEPCPVGWNSYQRKCILFEKTAKTFDEVQAQCSSLGAQLVSIQSADENEFISKQILVNEWTWLGGKTNGTGLSDFYWLHQSANTSYSNFMHEKILSGYGLVINGEGRWSYSDLAVKRQTLCEKPANICYFEAGFRVANTQNIVTTLHKNLTRILHYFTRRSEIKVHYLQKQIDTIVRFLDVLGKSMDSFSENLPEDTI